MNKKRNVIPLIPSEVVVRVAKEANAMTVAGKPGTIARFTEAMMSLLGPDATVVDMMNHLRDKQEGSDGE